MIRLLVLGGPYARVLALLAVVVVVLAVKKAIDLFGRSATAREGSARGVDAILFWGSLTAIFGFLGQWIGIYKAANALADYGLADPKLVLMGFGESLGTSVFGLFALVVAAFLWFGLRMVQHWRATI